MIRAEITRAQLKALRQIALETEVSMQKLVGDLIVDYLRVNGYEA